MTEKSKYSKLEQLRVDKIDKLRQSGVNPYPSSSKRTHTIDDITKQFLTSENEDVAEVLSPTVVGRIRSSRPMGKILFSDIEDGSGSIQLFLRENDLGKETLDFYKELLDLGDFVEAAGEMFRTRSGEVSLRVKNVTLISKAITPLPAAKDEEVDGKIVRHAELSDPELRYRQRYADLAVNPDIRKIFRIRAKVSSALREYLDGRDFLEVETPILQPIYGGAAARPFVTYHNQLKQDLYLRISFELYLKRLLVGGIERVYEIGRDFRNEGVDRTHNPEFTQLEYYWAYADYEDSMKLTEEMICFAAEKALGSAVITYQEHEMDLSLPWARVKLSDAIAEHSDIEIDKFSDAKSLAKEMKSKDMKADPYASRGALIDSIVGTCVEPKLIQPTFLIDYPKDISPLAKTVDGNDRVVQRFEGFVAGFELCNAFTELNDPIEQEERFLEMGRAYDPEDEEFHPIDEDYLRAMRYGMPPNSGFGMGLDRLVMLLTNQSNIREVLLFPHLRKLDD